MKTRALPLGADFGKLWSASIASNLADGLGRTAVPLIATTLTTDPVLIAGIGALAFLPWLLFGVLAGVIVDRVDRRVAMAVANGVRVIAAIVIALSISTDSLTIWLLYACVLVFGIGETVYDNATITIIPSVVERTQLERANSRMQAADVVVQNFVATPIAGLLFAAVVVLPVWSSAAGFLIAAVLALMLPISAGRALRAEPMPGAATGTRADIREAFAYLIGNRFLRNLVIVTSLIGAFVTLAQATILLFLLETLTVPIAAIGFVTAGVGVGAIIGSLVASGLVVRFGRGRVMLGATLVGGLGIGLVGLAPNVWVAVALFALGAGGIAVWNVPYGSLRQEIIPGRLLGRVIGMIRTVTWGLFPVAAILGGLLGRIDLRLPFLIGGGLVVVVVLLSARLLLSASDQKPLENADERPREELTAPPGVEPAEPLL